MIEVVNEMSAWFIVFRKKGIFANQKCWYNEPFHHSARISLLSGCIAEGEGQMAGREGRFYVDREMSKDPSVQIRAIRGDHIILGD